MGHNLTQSHWHGFVAAGQTLHTPCLCERLVLVNASVHVHGTPLTLLQANTIPEEKLTAVPSVLINFYCANLKNIVLSEVKFLDL